MTVILVAAGVPNQDRLSFFVAVVRGLPLELVLEALKLSTQQPKTMPPQEMFRDLARRLRVRLYDRE